MIHLRFGVSITLEAWRDLKTIKKPTLYLRRLSRAIWGAHDLMNRSVRLDLSKKRLDRSPRKALTPHKKAILRSKYFHDFLKPIDNYVMRWKICDTEIYFQNFFSSSWS